MDPLSIAASSFGIVGAIAKASISIMEFSQQAKDAAEDLQRVSSELQALSAILDPLARNVSRAPQGTVPAALAQQLGSSLDGCALVVARIETAVEKYQKDGAWTRTKWVMFGRGDVEKLRSSLEAYKMALSLGLHVVSVAVESSTKDDTGAIRNDTQALRQETAAIQVNTEEILARVMSLRNGARSEVGSRTRQWVDSMALLSSYAESSYQDTVIDPGEERDTAAHDTEGDRETVRGEEEALDTIPEFDPFELKESDGTQGVTSASAEVPEWQRHIAPTGPIRASPYLDTGDRPEGSSESREEMHETSHSAARSTVAPNIKNEKLVVVVALDIGGTSAAVAWMTGGRPPQVIREWPGGEGSRVPFRVVYDENETVLGWGFQCEGPESGTDGSDLSFTLFLRQLHGYISQTIVATLRLKPSDWARLGVEFHVTTPDLLRVLSPQMLSQRMEELKDQMRRSGIGTSSPRHRAVLGLTETEAVAISVLACLPVSMPPQQRLMLKIGLEHATIILAERSQTATKIHSCYSVRTPEPKSYIKRIVSTWLEKYPEIRENLGPDGLGLLVPGPMYHGVLHGFAPLCKPYTLRIDGLPKSFSHGAFDIKDGTLQLNRFQVGHIVNSLIDEISRLVIDALVDGDGRAEPPSAQMLRDIICLETADIPRYFASRICDALEQRSEMVSAAHKAARRRNSGVASGTALDEEIMLRITFAPPTSFGGRTTAAVEGLLVYRNAWNRRHRLSDFVEFHGLMSSRVYAQARIHAPWASSDDDPTLYLTRTDASGTDTWSPTPARITQHWQVSNYRCQPRDCKRLWLELYYTYNSHWPETESLEGGDPKKLCTVVWELEPWNFRSPTWKTKWWGLGEKRGQGTLEFTIYFSLMCPFDTGPIFQLLVPGGDSLGMPKSVDWHSEPPFLVWPAESKRNRGGD